MCGLEKQFPYEAQIKLKNGAVIDYANGLDLSAVPVVVEIWDEKIYNKAGLNIGADDTVFDLGSNVGNFALFAAKQTSGKVYAFEPVPKNFDQLQKNIQLNAAHNIVPVKAAVSGQTGTATINISTVDTAHSITHQAFSQKGNIEVAVYDLETYCREHNIDGINFLKVDCEGAEYEIFDHISDEMLGRIDKIAMEHHERFIKRDHALISNRLRAAGFTVTELPEDFIYAKRP